MELSAAVSKYNISLLKSALGTGLYALILTAYIFATKPAAIWIFNEIDDGAFIFGLMTACLLVVTLVRRMGYPNKALPIPALCVICVCGLGSVWTFSILQQLSASFALLGLYGFFAGLERVSAELWRKGLIMAGFAALALPFALVPGTGMGFYLRLVTADAAAQLLTLIGHRSLGAHDVLIFDNGIAQVDLPCSGLKSLFTGTGFFFIVSLLLRRLVNLKWILGYSIFAGLLIVANTFRVTILIWVSEILQQRAIAETIHMPLGLMLFCIVCLCGIFILYKLKPFSAKQDDRIRVQRRLSRYLPGLLTAGMLFAMFALTPQTRPGPDGPLTLPANLDAQSIGLTPTETDFFGARDRTSAGKWMFSYKNLSGSMLVVRSGAANGLHAPEVCLLGNGISVDRMETHSLIAGTYRQLSVDSGRRSAVYWMQSEQIVTDDFRKRLSNYIFKKQDDWVMVTLLLDQRLNIVENSADNLALHTLMQELQTHYATDIKRKRGNYEPT